MRWTLGITATLVVLLAVYLASPLIALQRIASAVEARDAVALSERLDVAALRRSFRKQMVTTYRELTGKKLPLGALSRRLAMSVADPIVARLMTMRALLALLGDGKAGEVAKVPADRAPFSSISFPSIWRLWLSADYLGRDFYIHLPPDGPRSERFGMHLRLIRWRWELVGVELPDELRIQLARELIEETQERLKSYDDRR